MVKTDDPRATCAAALVFGIDITSDVSPVLDVAFVDANSSDASGF